jgi:hypothetical protein
MCKIAYSKLDLVGLDIWLICSQGGQGESKVHRHDWDKFR